MTSPKVDFKKLVIPSTFSEMSSAGKGSCGVIFSHVKGGEFPVKQTNSSAPPSCTGKKFAYCDAPPQLFLKSFFKIKRKKCAMSSVGE